jgi:hypothetical protein
VNRSHRAPADAYAAANGSIRIMFTPGTPAFDAEFACRERAGEPLGAMELALKRGRPATIDVPVHEPSPNRDGNDSP